MKTKRIAFDINKAKAGAKVFTRSGLPVRIVDSNVANEKPILGLIKIEGVERPYLWMQSGEFSKLSGAEGFDLFIGEEEEEKHRREYSGTDSIYVPKDDEGIQEELIDAINGLWDNDALPMPLTLKRQTAWITWLQKQGGEKPADNKPKFQEGDWVTDIDKPGVVHQITDVIKNVNHTYGYNAVSFTYEFFGYSYFSEKVKSMRLWDINDAKDGDVLVCIGKHGQEIGIVKKYVGKYGGCDKCFETYCFVDWEGIFRLGEYIGSKEIYPATKEQRELLFQKIKEAGYKWDTNKKELREIREVKTRRMTNQELSWWLRDCPEEHREYCHKGGTNAHFNYYYSFDEADEEIEKGIILIRKNGGEWMEPLIEI